MTPTKKLVITALFCTIGIVSSHFLVIPLGIVRAFPVQHMVNVLLAVMVGTKYAVGGAFVVAVLRNLLGIGTLFAFPGSLVGAWLAGLIYQKTNRLLLAALGEAFGTGIVGSLLSYPIALFILGQDVTLFFVLPSFFFSSLVGALFSFILLKRLSVHQSWWKVSQKQRQS